MKKNIIFFIISLGLIFLVSGCGDNSNNSTSTSNVKSIDMVIGKTYTVTQGQTITKTSDPTIVEIETNTQTGVTTAVLKSGSAKIE